MNKYVQSTWLYLSLHWFKLGVLGILLYAFFSNDLSFKVELQSPDEAEPPVMEQSAPRPAVRRSTLTDNRLVGENRGVTDRLKLLWSGTEEQGEMPLIQALAQVPKSDIEAFLHRFIPVAVSEQQKFGVPASLTLANALLLSKAGKSAAALEGHNFFGLPCSSDWQGDTGQENGKCYRYYENAWMSFRDHSLYVTTGTMAKLRRLSNDDYHSWAKALEAEGFGAKPNLAAQIIRVIESYELAVHD